MILLSILLEIIRNSLKIRFPQNLPHHASTEWEDYWQRDWKPTGHCMTFDNGKQTVRHAYRDLRRCSDASANIHLYTSKFKPFKYFNTTMQTQGL